MGKTLSDDFRLQFISKVIKEPIYAERLRDSIRYFPFKRIVGLYIFFINTPAANTAAPIGIFINDPFIKPSNANPAPATLKINPLLIQ